MYDIVISECITLPTTASPHSFFSLFWRNRISSFNSSCPHNSVCTGNPSLKSLLRRALLKFAVLSSQNGKIQCKINIKNQCGMHYILLLYTQRFKGHVSLLRYNAWYCDFRVHHIAHNCFISVFLHSFFSLSISFSRYSSEKNEWRKTEVKQFWASQQSTKLRAFVMI